MGKPVHHEGAKDAKVWEGGSRVTGTFGRRARATGSSPFLRTGKRRFRNGLTNGASRALKSSPGHCRMIEDLSFHHRDPFNRLIIALALAIRFAVITSDEVFASYGVTR